LYVVNSEKADAFSFFSFFNFIFMSFTVDCTVQSMVKRLMPSFLFLINFYLFNLLILNFFLFIYKTFVTRISSLTS
jgi:hypothetical protein